MIAMNDGFDQLKRDFESKGISVDNPGFCDDPKFLAEERTNPKYLNNYCAYIIERPYDAGYLSRSKVNVEKAVKIIYRALLDHGRLGACVDICGILSRILDKENIWNCCVKGSLTIDFPPASRITRKHFWAIDHGQFVAPHVWICAPPYYVVDPTIRQQAYPGKERDYLPEFVLAERGSAVDVETDDIVSPTLRALMNARGIPESRQIYVGQPDIDEVLDVFPANRMETQFGSFLKYIPVAFTAPDAPLEKMTNMKFDGKFPWELYETKFRGKLG